MDTTEEEIEARRVALVARARARMKIPAMVMTLLGVLQLVSGLGVAIVGSRTGVFTVFVAGALWCLPGALTLGAGLVLARLRGWNLVFSGLLFSVAISLMVSGVLAFAALPFAWAPLFPAAIGMALLVWQARLEEDQEIRMARNLVYPPKPRDPVDYQVL